MIFWNLFLFSVIMIMSLESLFSACMMFLWGLILICMNIMNLNMTWIIYSLILVYVGGMMVLFIYMCSLETKINIESVRGMMSLGFLLMITFMVSSFNFYFKNFFLVEHNTIYALYYTTNFSLISLIILYLTTGLLISVDLCYKLKGPLKS